MAASDLASSDARFYVYEHWRPDLDLCIWVGKGTGDRASRFKRNADYNRIAAQLGEFGLSISVRIIANNLRELDALKLECERIAFWRASAVALTNRNDGGRGNRSMFVSDETREKLRLQNLGKKHSAETRAKMSRSQMLSVRKVKGRSPGFVHSEDTRAKMRLAKQGQTLSREVKEKLRLANLGKKASSDTRAKMSASHRRNPSPGIGARKPGLKRSPETKKRMSDAQKLRAPMSEATRSKLADAARAAPKHRNSNGKFRSSLSAD
jgi:hypothetical protein